ncbi:MAG TPA: tetratricopeptide repeat protein, partial [Arenicellales bacterium]|nr:tetratricopeptide repeat protein [Arenicellales bacterium]
MTSRFSSRVGPPRSGRVIAGSSGLVLLLVLGLAISGCVPETAVKEETCDSAYQERNYPVALTLCGELAEAGSVSDQLRVAQMYYFGQGTRKDLTKAVEWFQLAADNGSPDAQERLGILYENGEGVNQDFERAVYWYERAVEGGSVVVEARNNLAVMYEQGRGVEKNLDSAVRLYKEAVANGH